MKTVGKTVKWLLMIALLGSGAGGGYGYYLWQQTDELLRQRLLAKFQELAPEWKVEIGRTRFDLQGRIRIHDLKLKAADGQTLLLDVPEMVIVVDRDSISEPNPSIHQIRLVRPQLHLVRDPLGVWNWEGLPPPKMSGPLSEWQIEQASVFVRLERETPPDVSSAGPAGPNEVPRPTEARLAEGAAAAPVVALRNIDGHLIPSGKKQFKVKGTTKFDLADAVSLDGEWNLEAGSWAFNGGIGGLKVDAGLLDLLARFSPEAGRSLDQAAEFSTRTLAANRLAGDSPETGIPHGPGAQPAAPDVNRGPVVNTGIGQPADLGVNAGVDIQFRVAKWQPDAELEYKLTAVIKRGQVTNPLLPYALYDLRGNISVDNRQLSIRELSARNGTTVVGVNGDVLLQGEIRPAKITISVEDLVLEERIRACLPESRQKVYDSLQPTGKVDLTVWVTYNARDGWNRESDLIARGCTVVHTKFPYLVEQIEGTIKHRGDMLDIAMRGVAGQRPITLVGRVKNPGPEAEAVFDIEGTSLPIDGKLRAASPPAMQHSLDSLRLHGLFDGRIRISRPPGLNQKFTPFIVARLRECSANPKCFSYAMTGVTGIVEGIGDDWSFRGLRAQHENATIEGSGTFRRNEQGEGKLLLGVEVTGATFDQQLQAALPEVWQTVWKEFVPTGRLNATGRVEWSPGQPPVVQLDTRLIDAGLSMKSFPYVLDDVQAQISLGGGKLTITSLSGRHEETRVRMTGSGLFAPDGSWRVRLEDLFVDDLNPDRRFRKTLPPRLREIVETLDPRGKLSMSGTLEFAGTGSVGAGDGVTAAWNLMTVYSGATLTTGVDLENLHGRVTLNGTWDGEKVRGDGQIDLDSVSIKGHQLTDVKGPVQVDGTHLVIGSIDEVNRSTPEKGRTSNNSRRVTANFIDGVLALDGAAVLEKESSYHVRMELTGGRLERYSQLYMKKRYRLMGVMNGWVDFDGRGASAQRLKGRGQMVISPAALYELPVIVAIFKILNFAPPDKTAFRQALVVFDIGGGQFQLRRADLNGDAITLRGRGYIPFDGPMRLDFYSTAGGRHLPIPIVGPLIGGATEGWVGVEVRGTMADPVANVRALPQMDDALRGFLGIFDGRPPATGQRGAGSQRQPRR